LTIKRRSGVFAYGDGGEAAEEQT